MYGISKTEQFNFLRAVIFAANRCENDAGAGPVVCVDVPAGHQRLKGEVMSLWKSEDQIKEARQHAVQFYDLNSRDRLALALELIRDYPGCQGACDAIREAMRKEEAGIHEIETLLLLRRQASGVRHPGDPKFRRCGGPT